MRISSAPTFMQCAGFHICRSQEADVEHVAATNGTTVGRAVELWHKGSDPEAAVQQAVAENPTCEGDKVRGWFNGYRMDPRNGNVPEHQEFGAVIPDLQEAEVMLTINGCYFVGHIDQARRGYVTSIWDLKASSFAGSVLIYTYAAQLALYTCACEQTWGFPCHPGGIIRMTSYGPRATVSPFYPAQWSREDAWDLVHDITDAIKDARRGKFQLRPGHQCSYCPGGGLSTCRAMVTQIVTGRCPVCGKNAKPNRVTCCEPACIATIKGKIEL